MSDTTPHDETPPAEEAATLPLFPDAERPLEQPGEESEPAPTAAEPAPAAETPAPEPTAETAPRPSEPSPGTDEATSPDPAGRATLGTVTPEERARILQLHDEADLGTRGIAKAVGRTRKTVKRVLREEGRLESPTPSTPPQAEPAPSSTAAKAASKLDPYRAEIDDRIGKGLTVTRILREIRTMGYEGGRTILSDYVRAAQAPLAPRRKVTRRFETPPGEESQCDWSTYRVVVGGVLTVVHVLAVVLAHSRRSFLWATDSQRLERLLEGLSLALESFQGVSLKIVFDNMAQVSLGRVGRDRKPIWNEGFLPFVSHYGFEPTLCQIAHPDRKGEVEAVLGYFERDCLRGLEPESLAELNQAIRAWTNGVANKRVHGTTGRVPDEVWAEERDFLIPLPERRYPGACVEEVRRVAEDCTVSILGTPYTVPSRLAHRQARVRLYTEHFEVLDRDGSVAFARAYVAPREKGRLQLEPEHYADLPRPRPRSRPGEARRLEDQLLERCPSLEGFVAGLKRHVKGLVHVHVRKLLRLGERYGDDALVEAALRADGAKLHKAQAVERILEADFEELADPDPVLPLGAEARVDALLGDVESGSLDDYAHLDDATSEALDVHEDGSDRESAEEERHGS